MVSTSQKIAALIDHTNLSATASASDIEQLCREAVEYSFYSVCVNSRWIEECAAQLKNQKVLAVAVSGFPLGATKKSSKLFEIEDCLKSGAGEIDMVIDLGSIKSGKTALAIAEVKSATELCASANAKLKVILEICHLSMDEISLLSRECSEVGAHFVKTSTGFGPSGASVEAVAAMRAHAASNCGVKASGGIRNYQDFKKMVDAGANRVGCSASIKIIKEFEDTLVSAESTKK